MDNITYEKAIKRLEEIVSILEDGNMDLDESMKLFEEGTKLSAYCNEYLNVAEQKIIELSSNISQSEESIDE